MAGRQRGNPPPSHQREDRLILRHATLEEQIGAQNREIQALLLDNQRLVATHVALKEDLSMAHQEVRQLTSAACKIREERDMEIKTAFERSLKLESEVREIDAINAELAQVRADIQRLTENKIELTARFKAIDAELERAKLEVREIPALRADIESMHHELRKGRAAIEFEKKTQASNLEHKRIMERNTMTMQHEIDRLRAELADAEKRARATAAATTNPNPGYMGNYENPNMMYGGGPYPGQYPTQNQGPTTGNSAPQAPFDMQQAHVPEG